MKRSAKMIPLDSWMGFETIAVYGGSHDSIGERAKIKFRRGEDDLDDTWEVALRLPSGRKIALVEHLNAPQVGTSIMFAGERAAVPDVLRETLDVLNLQPRRVQWTVVPFIVPLRRRSRDDASSLEAGALKQRNRARALAKRFRNRFRFGCRQRAAASPSQALDDTAD